MTGKGEEKMIPVAPQIAKTLGKNESTTYDTLQMFSNFDDIFFAQKLQKRPPENDPGAFAAMERTIKSLDRQISRYLTADHPIWYDSADSSAFLDAVDMLIATIRDWTPMAGEKSVRAYLVRADDLLQQAMFRLEGEFRSLMESAGQSFDVNRACQAGDSGDNLCLNAEDDDEDARGIPVAKPVMDFDIVIDALPSGTISDLHEIAKRMVAAGFGEECSRVYSSCRREFLEESLSRLGFQKLRTEEQQNSPSDDEIDRWIVAVNFAVRILFPSEHRLCKRVFFGFSSTTEFSFVEVCRETAIQLLNFADAVATGLSSPEKLFKVLDVFETLRDLMPELESTFSDRSCSFLMYEAMNILKRLAKAVRGIFTELENKIRRDPAKTAIPGGGIHPMTRYVTNYLLAACRSRETLDQIFEENAIPTTNLRSTSSSLLSVQIAWTLELLESNLAVKSKLNSNSALSSVFMMNNLTYMEKKVENSELGLLLGADWTRNQRAKIRQWLVNYQKISWNKILAVLRIDDGSSSVAPNVAVKFMRDKLRLFRTYFEENCETQSAWIIADERQREEVRNSLTRSLLPAYLNFIGRYKRVLENEKRAEKFVVDYSADEIRARISHLFEGGDGSPHDRRGR